MDDLRFCPQGCCRFINSLSVSNADYESIPRPLLGVMEAMIPCRRNPGQVQKSVEDIVGFFLGSPLKRTFGTLLPTGGRPIVFDATTGSQLREATDEDMKNWSENWNQVVKAAREEQPA